MLFRSLHTVQEWIVAPQVKSVAGVAGVDSLGGYDKEYLVVPDVQKLAALKLSLSDLATGLEANNSAIGGGIVENGRLLAGRDGSAGEIGHTRVSDSGPPCGCGGRGCLEAHLAPARLAALWKGDEPDQARGAAVGGEAPDEFSRLLAAAREGDGRARKVLAEAAGALARGLGNVVSLLNPEQIILGGRFVEAGETILDPLRRGLPAQALPEMLQGVEVRLAELGETSAFLGVAARVRNQLFAYPSVGARVGGGGTKGSDRVSSEESP